VFRLHPGQQGGLGKGQEGANYENKFDAIALGDAQPGFDFALISELYTIQTESEMQLEII
jgi:hypothetical protein